MEQAATDEHRTGAINMTKTKLLNNGYPHDWLKRLKRSRPIHEKEQHEIRPGYVLKLPFITDQFKNCVRYVLKKYKIAACLVNYKG